MANQLKGKVAQLEGIELFKVPNFSLEFVKVAFNYMQNKPLIIYIRNLEKMLSNMNNFNFIYDKVCASKVDNVILIASMSNQPPKAISEKFHYVHCIRPADKNQKSNYIKFISQKIGIQINMSDQDLNTYAFQNLHNYSNEDIFNLIKTAIELKKKEVFTDFSSHQIYPKSCVKLENDKYVFKDTLEDAFVKTMDVFVINLNKFENIIDKIASLKVDEELKNEIYEFLGFLLFFLCRREQNVVQNETITR